MKDAFRPPACLHALAAVPFVHLRFQGVVS